MQWRNWDEIFLAVDWRHFLGYECCCQYFVDLNNHLLWCEGWERFWVCQLKQAPLWANSLICRHLCHLHESALWCWHEGEWTVCITWMCRFCSHERTKPEVMHSKDSFPFFFLIHHLDQFSPNRWFLRSWFFWFVWTRFTHCHYVHCYCFLIACHVK